MTLLPDHRDVHGPHQQCEGCQLPPAAAYAPPGYGVPNVPSPSQARTDLVFLPGANRK